MTPSRILLINILATAAFYIGQPHKLAKLLPLYAIPGIFRSAVGG